MTTSHSMDIKSLFRARSSASYLGLGPAPIVTQDALTVCRVGAPWSSIITVKHIWARGRSRFGSRLAVWSRTL